MGITPSKCLVPKKEKGSQSSEGDITKVKNIMKDSFTSKNSESKVKVLTDQKVIITRGEIKYTARDKENLAKNYICSPTSKMKKNSFPMYNCNYDVTQNTDMKILKIDETTLSNVTNIVSKIEAEIENKFPAKGSDKKVSKGLKDPVISDKIKHVMKRYKEENITKVPGEINITITKPIKCNNPCEGDNANPLITDEVVMDKMIDEIYDFLPIHERIIKYEDKEKMQVGDKILTPEERKKQKDYCTAVMVANIVGIFILACVFTWILLLIFD